MAKFVSTNAYVLVNAVDLSAFMKSVAVKLSKEDLDATGMNAAAAKSRLMGLADGDIEIEFMQDFAAASVDATLYAIWNGGVPVTVAVKPVNAATSATNPQYSVSAVLPDYTPIDAQIGQVAPTRVVFKANGAVSKATS